MRWLPLVLLSGCAKNLWDARQVECSELDEIVYATTDDWPLFFRGAPEVDERCEVKTHGIRDAVLRLEEIEAVEDGERLLATDVHRIELEVEAGVFESPAALPLLGLDWVAPTGPSRITGLDFTRIDFGYEPAIDRLYMEAVGEGNLAYSIGRVDISCTDCFVNARVDVDIHLDLAGDLEGLPAALRCSEFGGDGGADSGHCTFLSDDSGNALRAHEICIGAGTESVTLRGTDDNFKLIVLPQAADSALDFVSIETSGTVEIVGPPLLRFRGSHPDGAQLGLPIEVGGNGVDFDFLGDPTLITRSALLQERQARCQLGSLR